MKLESDWNQEQRNVIVEQIARQVMCDIISMVPGCDWAVPMKKIEKQFFKF